MNIAILCDFPFPNGLAATNRIISYSKGLVNFGNTVTVYVYRPTEKKTLIRNPNGVGDFEGVLFKYPYNNTIRFSSKLLHLFENIFGIVNTFYVIKKNQKKQPIDVLIISNDNPFILFIFSYLSRLIKTKKIVFIFDEFPKPIRKKLKLKIPYWKKTSYKKILSNFNGFISISKELLDYYGMIVQKDIKSLVLSSVVNTQKFLINDTTIRGDYICYMGNFELAKDNVDNIIKAFSLISNKWENLKLYIYGKGNQSDEAFIVKLINDLNLNEKVILMGRVDFKDVPKILKGAKILVSSQPNTYRAKGGFPTKLGEYLVSSTPTIMTDVGEIHLYVKDQVNGYLVKPEDPLIYAKKMDHVLTNYNEALEVAKKGQEYILNNFDIKIQGKRMNEFLLEL